MLYGTFIELNNKYRAHVLSHNRHRLDASCGFYRFDLSCQHVTSKLLPSSSCVKSENQTICNLIFTDLLQVTITTYIKLVDKKS